MRRCFNLFVCLVLSALTRASRDDSDGINDPDYDRDTCQIVVSRGFGCKTFHPTTRDNYILTAYQIVNPHVKRTRGTVLLMHCLFGTSIDYVIPDGRGYARAPPPRGSIDLRSSNMALEFANHGYDVWLGNFRGNPYATNHTKLSVADKAYWDFSFDEMVEEDLPTLIAFITMRTGASELFFR